MPSASSDSEFEAVRAARRSGGSARDAHPGDLALSPFRVDRDRVASSAFFARLGGVTQVVSPSGSGVLLHNRLTHSLKVAQVARAIAERLLAVPEQASLITTLGGCDLDVVEAAALAHDLGHPPFGHLGEQVLDRLARQRFALPDGFEGNAQTFRIASSIDVRGTQRDGLDLTAASRAALLKYPWTRLSRPQPHPRDLANPPRGASEPADAPGSGSSKFSCYVTELDDMNDCRAGFAERLELWQQTVEASIMDTADDIAYAIHDLDDFHRVGVLQHTTVQQELDSWLRDPGEFLDLSDAELAKGGRLPGRSLEQLRRRLHARDGWIADDAAFFEAARKVSLELVERLLKVPFDRSREAEHAVAVFSGEGTRRLVEGVEVVASPTSRSGHVSLRSEQWHEVQILKFVHRRFVLQRPDLGLHQRGQDQLLRKLVAALNDWMVDSSEAFRLPHRLRDLLDRSRDELGELRSRAPELLVAPGEQFPTGSAGRERLELMARGRAVIDFISSLTDGQAANLLEALAGQQTQWAGSYVL